MKILAIHHTVSRQNILKPEDVGGKYKFYNRIVSAEKTFIQHNDIHNRGGCQTYDIALAGDFRKDIPTDYQRKTFWEIVREYNLPVIGHKDLGKFGATINTILPTECPANLLKNMNIKLKIQCVNGSMFDEINQQIQKFSRGHISCEFDNQNITIIPGQGMFTQDDAYKLADELNITAKFLVIHYQGNATSTFRASYYYPKKDICITTSPLPISPRDVAWELSHQFQYWLNSNRCL